MIIFSLILAFLLGTANMVYADSIVILEEHFPNDPIERGWTYSGNNAVPFTWKADKGNAGAMFAFFNMGPQIAHYTELVSPSFSTVGAVSGSLTFNYEKNVIGMDDGPLDLQYRLGHTGFWTSIWSSGLGHASWPTRIEISIPDHILDNDIVFFRWLYDDVGGFAPYIVEVVVDDVVLEIEMGAEPAPTATPTQPECLNHGDVNFDGLVTSSDAQLAFQITLGTYSPTFEEGCAADCNGNSIVTADDAQMIFQAGLGIGTCVDTP